MKFKSGIKIRLYAVMLFLSYLLFTYYALGGWWHSSLGMALILFFSYLIWKKDYLKITGLKISVQAVICSFILALGLTVLFCFAMHYVAGKNGVVISLTGVFNYYHIFFYTLNEEIILGAIVIYLAVSKLKIKPILVSVLLASMFSIIHFVFYQWIFLERGTIGLSTLITLFMVGFLRNNIIIRTGHIGYSWALHFSWMVIMFGLFHSHFETDEKLLEFERFNLYLGSVEVLAVSCIAALLSLFLLKKKK